MDPASRTSNAKEAEIRDCVNMRDVYVKLDMFKLVLNAMKVSLIVFYRFRGRNSKLFKDMFPLYFTSNN